MLPLKLPKGYKRAKLDFGSRLRYSPSGEHVLASLRHTDRTSSAGVWTASGELVQQYPGYSSLAWLHDGSAFLRATSDGHIRLELLGFPDLKPRAHVELTYPSVGVGGLILSVSSSSRYAALLTYSGQSEESYELFELSSGGSAEAQAPPQHIGGLPYRSGESGLQPIVFSPDEQYAAFALNERPFWWSTDDDADFDSPATGGLVEWAALYLHRLGVERPERYALAVEVAKGWIPDEGLADNCCPTGARFTDALTLRLELPWGITTEIAIGDARQLVLADGSTQLGFVVPGVPA